MPYLPIPATLGDRDCISDCVTAFGPTLGQLAPHKGVFLGLAQCDTGIFQSGATKANACATWGKIVPTWHNLAQDFTAFGHKCKALLRLDLRRL